MGTMIQSAKETDLLLAESHSDCAEFRIVYRLYAYRRETGTQFYMTATANGEYSQVPLRADLYTSVDAFRAVVNGSVTPCVLEEVVKDLLFANKW